MVPSWNISCEKLTDGRKVGQYSAWAESTIYYSNVFRYFRRLLITHWQLMMVPALIVRQLGGASTVKLMASHVKDYWYISYPQIQWYLFNDAYILSLDWQRRGPGRMSCKFWRRDRQDLSEKMTWNFSFFLWTHDMEGLKDKLQGLINTCRLAKRGEELPLEEQLWTPLHRYNVFLRL